MTVFELRKPGTWVASSDPTFAHAVEPPLDQLVSNFVDANASLNLFEEAQDALNALHAKSSDLDNWDKDRRQRAMLQTELESLPSLDEFGPMSPYLRHCAAVQQADILFKRERWGSGAMPNSFLMSNCFIAAKAFLFAIDNIDRLMEVLAKTAGAPQELAVLHGELQAAFPSLRGVRNSAHHQEDRARGIGSGRKQMTLKPIAAGGILASGGALVMSNLHGSKYGCTLGDGTYGEIDVSPTSMKDLQRVVQAALDVFLWTGQIQHFPM